MNKIQNEMQEDSFEESETLYGSKKGLSSSFSAAKLMASIVQLHLDLRDSLTENEAALLPSGLPQSEGDFKKLKSDPCSFFHSLKTLVVFIKEQKEELRLQASQAADAECSSYEGHLQKLEADVRQHIRVEQQLKLFVENSQEKLEDYERMEKLVKEQAQEIREAAKRAETLTVALDQVTKERNQLLEEKKSGVWKKSPKPGVGSQRQDTRSNSRTLRTITGNNENISL